ncbi:histidine--tRNA ligase [Candidatus Gottesmanbacteria bacterium]|nr:histidine--tRNA ligase [Candidatus Gottesmanbacteria bacterium]
MIKPQTLKGFRDFLPADAIKRQFVIGKMKQVFERFGFDPLETPALEYAETLLGKYGNEADKLLYLFEDNGGRNVGLRYDQTVPLSRVMAQYGSAGSPQVLRAENTQKGRYREFLQCDIDTVGTDSPLADAEVIACTLEVMKALGFENVIMLINDRRLFEDLGLTKKQMIIIDKLDKIGDTGVIKELSEIGTKDPEGLFKIIRESMPSERLSILFATLERQGYKQGKNFEFTPFLARGLDYYTSTIFELKTKALLSLAGGGRYDKLIGQFSGQDAPAVGIAFGFDRIVEAMEELGLLPDKKTTTQVLVTMFSPELFNNAIEIANKFRISKINVEVFPEETKLDKQLKYADRKGIPYAIIAGPEEVKSGVVKLKNMQTQEQVELTVDEVIEKLTSNLIQFDRLIPGIDG